MTRILLLLATVLALLFVFATMSFASAEPPAAPTAAEYVSQPIPDQYIVVLKQGAASAAGIDVASLIAERNNVAPQQTFNATISGFVANLDANELTQLQNDPVVDYIEQDRTITIQNTQANPVWGLDRIDQPDLPLNNAYGYTEDGTGVNAYIIDTGIRATHVEFGGRVNGGFTSIIDGNGTDDCQGHGTHVAGTVGGSTYGVAKNVNLIPVRVLDCAGSGTFSGVIAGIDWVTQNAVAPAVANMSLGGGASQAVDDAVRASINAGVTYVLAAGNSYADACNYSPARTLEALTVGASDSIDIKAGFSNYGTCVDMFAPGVGVLSASNGSDTATAALSGTSMAAPHVAGVVALYLDANPTALQGQVAADLIAAAAQNRLNSIGGGSPNLLLQSPFAGSPVVPTPTPPTPTPSPTPAPPTTTHPTNDHVYISLNRNGQVNQSLNYRDEDVVAFNLQTNQWEMVFDGSDVGIRGDIDGIIFDDNGDLLLSLKKETTVAGIGLVDDSDIIRFIPNTFGPSTSGAFEMYFDASDVGLTSNGEDVDAVGLHYDGRIFISTSSTATVLDGNGNNLTARDEDLIIFNHSQFGEDTSGSFEMFMDGSDMALNNGGGEDVWAASIDASQIFLSTKATFSAMGVNNNTVTGSGVDIFACVAVPTATGFDCAASFSWPGATNGIPSSDSIDALSTGRR